MHVLTPSGSDPPTLALSRPIIAALHRCSYGSSSLSRAGVRSGRRWMPSRSLGCAACRRRKIRCDQTQPSCERCGIYGIVCPGYRTEGPGRLEFQDLTSLTAQKAQQHYHGHDSGPSRSPPDAALVDPASPPVGICSGAVNRARLYATFMDLFVPTDCKLQCDDFSFFKTCMSPHATGRPRPRARRSQPRSDRQLAE